MNVGALVDLQRHRRASAPALITEDDVWTHGRLADSTEAFAAFLAEHGVGPGERVALLSANCAEYVCAMLAIYRLGAIAVPLNFRLQREELAYLVRHAGPVAAICQAEFLPLLQEVTAELTLRARVRLGGERPAPNWQSFEQILREYAGRSVAVAPVQTDDIQRIMYTSGTTSRPKGVIVTHEMATYNMFAHTTELELSAADRVLICSPLFHVAAWDAPGIGVLFNGGSLVIMRAFDPLLALQLIEEHHVTGAHLVRSILQDLLAAADESRDLSCLRWIIFGGVSPELYDRVQGMLPATRLAQGYGMTEACSAIAYTAHSGSKPGTVGTAVPFVEYRIVDEHGNVTAPDVEGEVVARGPKITPGYWADDTSTESAWRGGWFHTGDVGVIDADGYLSITDRLKDMIRSGGENVGSQEIERVICAHPGVAEAAVIGVPDPRWQEVPMAFVVLTSGAELTETELIEHCRSRLASFKTPKAVAFVARLPRNPSGKVLKNVLRDDARAKR